MSLDLVDDLQAAEDRISYLESVLRGPVGGRCLAADDTWCRPSCEDHDHDDLDDSEAADCGCPAHERPMPETPLAADPGAALPPSQVEMDTHSDGSGEYRTCAVVTCDLQAPVGLDHQALCPPHRADFEEWKASTDGF